MGRPECVYYITNCIKNQQISNHCPVPDFELQYQKIVEFQIRLKRSEYYSFSILSEF